MKENQEPLCAATRTYEKSPELPGGTRVIFDCRECYVSAEMDYHTKEEAIDEFGTRCFKGRSTIRLP